MALYKLASNISSYLLEKGLDYLTEKGLDSIVNHFQENEFDNRLVAVINETIAQYEFQYPDNSNNPFYSSETILSELLKFRFTGDITPANIIDLIQVESNIKHPTKSEIEYFLTLFTTNANNDSLLRKFNLKHNTQEEIFKISNEIKKGFGTIISELEDIKREVYNKVNRQLELDWMKQIEEINKNIQDFKPITALERIDSLLNRFREASVLNETLEAKLLYINGICHLELTNGGIIDNASKAFIAAYKKVPSNLSYKEYASLSYCSMQDFDKGIEIAKDILQEDEYNITAWLVLSITQKSNHIEYQKQIPKVVKDNTSYQLNLIKWLIATTSIQALSELDELRFSILINKPELPKQINQKNRAFWTMLTNIFTYKYYQENRIQSTHNINGDVPEINTVIYLQKISKQIINAIKKTELEDANKELEFEYNFFSYLCKDYSNQNEQELILEKLYKQIENPSQINTLQLASVYNTNRNLQKSIILLNEYKQNKLPSFHIMNMISYTLLEEIGSAKKSFKEYVDSISEPNDLLEVDCIYNIILYFDITHQNSQNAKEDFDYIVSKRTFVNSWHYDLLELYISDKKQQNDNNLDIDNRIQYILNQSNNSTLQVKHIIAVLLLKLSRYDDAVIFLEKLIVNSTEVRTQELYCDAIYRSKKNLSKLIDYLSQQRNKGKTSLQLLHIEISLHIKLNNWKVVIEICMLGLSMYPETYNLAYQYLVALEREHEINKINDFSRHLENYKFDETTKRYIAAILYRAGIHKMAIDYLYPIALNKENHEARMEYLNMLIYSNQQIYPSPTTAEIGTHIRYTIGDNQYYTYLTEENIQNDGHSSLLGKAVGDKIEIGSIQNGDLATGTIDSIHNDQNHLLNQILKENQSPLFKHPIKSFKIENDNPESLKKSMIKAVGIEGSLRQDFINNSLKDFHVGAMPFSFTAMRIFKDDIFHAFFALTDNSSECFRALPSALSNNLHFPNDTQYVLDVTSIIILYELSKLHNVTFKHRFKVSSYVKNILIRKIIELENSNKPKFSANVTLNNMIVIGYPDNYYEEQLEMYNDIEKWITSNCDYEHSIELLELQMKENNIDNENIAVNYLTETNILASKEKHVLITIDTLFLKYYNQSDFKQISIDNYIKQQYPEYNLDIRKLLIKKKLLGITIDIDLLISEYEKKISNQANNFHVCLVNLRFDWNPEFSHISSSVRFIRWLYLLPYISNSEKARTTNFIFINLLHGFPQKYVKHILKEIDVEFKLLPLHKSDVLNELDAACNSIIMSSEY